VGTTYAQPQNDWVRTYDLGANETITDIYRLQDGNIAVCGYTQNGRAGNDLTKQYWFMRLDAAGELIWTNTYGEQNVCESPRSIIESDNGDFVAAGFIYTEDGMNPSAIRANGDGEEIWLRAYEGTEFFAIIELKSGAFLMCGYASGNGGDGLLTCINGEGDVLWRRTYDVDNDFDALLSMRETDGEVVAVGTSSDLIWILKVNTEQGDIIWSRRYEFDLWSAAYSITSAIEGGFAIAGVSAFGRDGDYLLLKISNQGFIEWSRTYDIAGGGIYEVANCITRMSNGGYGLTGGRWSPSGGAFIKVNSEGEEEWQRSADEILENQSSYFTSVIGCPDQSVINAGVVTLPETGQDGFLVKFVPERSAPLIIEHNPEETELTVLRGDTIQFDVYALDAQYDPMEFAWTIGEDTLSVDTFAVITFPDLGDFTVNCTVSDSTGFSDIQWDVHVREFTIRNFEPANLALALQRGTSVNFVVEIETLDELEYELLWTLTYRNQQREEIGSDNSVTVQFDHAGEHQLQALVTSGETSEEVNWIITVRSVIWSWWPGELELSAYVDSTYEFIITPFNENSDSLEYLWFIDDEQLEVDSSHMELSFPETNRHEVTSIVIDGIESDTICWIVDVLEWSFTADGVDFADLPTTPVLYPVSPNPFNSSVKLSIYLPREDFVVLSVFDINGREVSRLVEGNVGAGRQLFVWNATGFPAGVYVVWMEAGDVLEMRKVVLVR